MLAIEAACGALIRGISVALALVGLCVGCGGGAGGPGSQSEGPPRLVEENALPAQIVNLESPGLRLPPGTVARLTSNSGESMEVPLLSVEPPRVVTPVIVDPATGEFESGEYTVELLLPAPGTSASALTETIAVEGTLTVAPPPMPPGQPGEFTLHVLGAMQAVNSVAASEIAEAAAEPTGIIAWPANTSALAGDGEQAFDAFVSALEDRIENGNLAPIVLGNNPDTGDPVALEDAQLTFTDRLLAAWMVQLETLVAETLGSGGGCEARGHVALAPEWVTCLVEEVFRPSAQSTPSNWVRFSLAMGSIESIAAGLAAEVNAQTAESTKPIDPAGQFTANFLVAAGIVLVATLAFVFIWVQAGVAIQEQLEELCELMGPSCPFPLLRPAALQAVGSSCSDSPVHLMEYIREQVQERLFAELTQMGLEPTPSEASQATALVQSQLEDRMDLIQSLHDQIAGQCGPARDLLGTWSGTWTGTSELGESGPLGNTVGGTWSLSLETLDLNSQTATGTLNWTGVDAVVTPIVNEDGEITGHTFTPFPVSETRSIAVFVTAVSSNEERVVIHMDFQSTSYGTCSEPPAGTTMFLVNVSMRLAGGTTSPAASVWQTSPCSPDGDVINWSTSGGSLSGQRD